MKIYLVLKSGSKWEEASVIAAYKDSQRAYGLVEYEHGRDDLWVQEIDLQEKGSKFQFLLKKMLVQEKKIMTQVTYNDDDFRRRICAILGLSPNTPLSKLLKEIEKLKFEHGNLIIALGKPKKAMGQG